MKKLFIYFVLVSSLFCGISRASGLDQDTIRRAAKTDPYYIVNGLFERGFKDNDYRDRIHIQKAAAIISKLYPDRPDLQKQMVNAWGQCMHTCPK